MRKIFPATICHTLFRNSARVTLFHSRLCILVLARWTGLLSCSYSCIRTFLFFRSRFCYHPLHSFVPNSAFICSFTFYFYFSTFLNPAYKVSLSFILSENKYRNLIALFNFQRRTGLHSSPKVGKDTRDANLDIVKGCQLAGQVTVCEIGTSSAGARSRSFSDIVCRLTPGKGWRQL